MFKILFFFLFLACLIGLSVWLTDNPGSVTIYWLGYEIRTYFGVLLVSVLVLLIFILLIVFFVLFFLLFLYSIRNKKSFNKNNIVEIIENILVKHVVGIISLARKAKKVIVGIDEIRLHLKRWLKFLSKLLSTT